MSGAQPCAPAKYNIMDFRGRNIDIVGKQNLWFAISLTLIIVGMVAWAAFGLNYGIDFKGGGQFQYRIPVSKRPAAGSEVNLLNQARTVLEQKGLRGARLQIAGGNTLVVVTDARDEAELRSQQRIIQAALGGQLRGTDANGQPQELRLIGQQRVGPVIGRELRQAAINGVMLGVLLIAAWIYIRYNFAGEGLHYAVAGIVALVHDVLVLVGLFALIGRIDPRVEVDGSFIAALLTVVGYSINDSVVIFDRIRENLRNRRKEPYLKIVNDSLLETMSRSINTGLTVLIMLFVLLFRGGESIYNFVLAMLLGIASGLYSSIFNAAIVLTAWHKYEEKRVAAARGARLGARRDGRTVTVRDVTKRPSLSSGAQPRLSSATPATGPIRPAPVNTGAVSAGAINTGVVNTENTAVAAPPVPATLAARDVAGETQRLPETAASANSDGSGINDIMDNGAASGAVPATDATAGGATRGKTPTTARPSRKARAKRRF
jgi:preprotein translocase subunit SecF